METKVVFSTIIGRVPVCADLTLSMSDKFLSGDVESLREHVTACVSIEKANANTWMEGHKRFNVDFILAVLGDIRALQKQNEEYAAKEDNGRHHVDLKTLKVNEIWIDGKYLRIEWYFKDCYGGGRLFAGNVYPVREAFQDTNHENFYCSSKVGLQVYF
jgi:hypothetical protein